MRPHDAEHCRSLPLFADMSAETFRNVIAGAYMQRFPANTLLLLEGDAADFLYVLLEGQVELHGAWNDQETVLSVLRPVSTFILAALVLDCDALMSARTLDRCEILMIPGDAIRKAMSDDARFGMAVSRDLAGGYRTMVRAVKNQKLRNGVERLANHLVTLHASEPSLDGVSVLLQHEKRVLASLLGMTPENLSRAFAALRAYGVEVRGAHVTLTNVNALVGLAKPDSLIDNHAPHTAEVVTNADAEIWSTQAARAAAARRTKRRA
ncbi:MAG: cyclic nucleotide-binding domain-containing protein [Terricaulis sp.]